MAKKLYQPQITEPVHCRLVPVAEPLLPYFRWLFETMKSPGTWATTGDAQRAWEYWNWQEAMMLCDLSTQLQQQQERSDTNFCVLISFIVAALSDGTIPAQTILGLCNIVRLGIEMGSGTPEYIDAEQTILNINIKSVGGDINQLELYNKVIADLLGPNTLPEPD